MAGRFYHNGDINDYMILSNILNHGGLCPMASSYYNIETNLNIIKY